MFLHCGFLVWGTRRPLAHAKLNSTNLKIGPCHVNCLVYQTNGRYRAPLELCGYGQRDFWFVESVEKLSRQQSLVMNFCDCQSEA